MDGPRGRVVSVKPQNLTVVVGLLNVLEFLPDLFKEEAGAYTRSRVTRYPISIQSSPISIRSSSISILSSSISILSS